MVAVTIPVAASIARSDTYLDAFLALCRALNVAAVADKPVKPSLSKLSVTRTFGEMAASLQRFASWSP